MATNRERAVAKYARSAKRQVWYWNAVFIVPVVLFVGAFLLVGWYLS